MSLVAWTIAGIAVVALAGADLVNTLIAPTTSIRRWWPTMIVGRGSFGLVRWAVARLGNFPTVSEAILMIYAPILLLVLLTMWVLMEIVGFGMIFWGLADNPDIAKFGDATYYSGIVFFTVGFGDILPLTPAARTITFIEALFGVGTVALVIGYLPAIYGAYSDRERALMSLDAGTSDEITSTDLVIAWAPDADPARLNEAFDRWEKWAAEILETHTTSPLLVYMRSANPKQNWVTALGLLSDAAMHAQLIVGASDGASFWFLRRAEAIANILTEGYDITDYVERERSKDSDDDELIDLYAQLARHGFEVYPIETSRHYLIETRAGWAPQVDYLVDYLMAPKRFWSVPSTVKRIQVSVPAPSSSARRQADPDGDGLDT